MARLAIGAVLALVVSMADPPAMQAEPGVIAPDEEIAIPVVEVYVGTMATVRLTWYAQSGLTANGGHTYPGSAACSFNYPFFTRFVFRDGEMVVCTDRGVLGNKGWVDVFQDKLLADKYGAYTDVVVIQP